MHPNEFPRMLFKKSDAPKSTAIWDFGTFETKIVHAKEEAEALLVKGWTLHPADKPAEPAKAAEKPKASVKEK